MDRIQVAGSGLADLFNSEKCRIGNGAVVIDLMTCGVTINPTITIDNAARLAASTIYRAMQPEEASSSEPEWLNKVAFSSEGFEDKPAVRVIDNQVWYNTPPFVSSKRNLKFWELFAKYWYVMCVKAMQRALVGRADRTSKEESIINTYGGIEV